ncbi:MAG TPA: cytochrome c oxidase assembly protein [Gaiellales bacterium]|jgi:putative membrane protein
MPAITTPGRPAVSALAGRPRRRAGLAAIACVLAGGWVLLAPPFAQAHGGARLDSRSVGMYRVTIDARAIRDGGRLRVVDYTVSLHTRARGRPVEDGRVEVTAQTPAGRVGPLRTRRRGSSYEAVIPLATGDWRDVRLDVHISSHAGAADLAYRPAAPAFTWPWRAPLPLGGAVAACLLYGIGFARLRGRGRRDLASIGRLCAFAGGIALALLAVVSPLDPLGERYLLSLHMLQHVLLGDAAPALIIVGLRGPLALFAMPRALLSRLGRSRRVHVAGRALLRPPVTLGLWAAAYGGWHVPAAYDAVLGNPYLHDLEHACFFTAGLLVWTLLIDPLRHNDLSLRGRMCVAIALFALGMVLADVLILSPHVLYTSYGAEPIRLWGISPLTDERLAGGVMMLEQGASLALCVALLVRAERRQARLVPARSRAALA